MNACNKNAITMQEKGACGYTYPSIDATKCIDCGLCSKVCPVNNPVTLNAPIKAFAAISKEGADLLSSSSGAASSVIATHIISNGGVVYGCVQENYQNIAHRRIDNLRDVQKTKGSKYVQSNIGLVYRDVKKDLTEGKKVLFTGTPCQVAGLRNYLRKDYENLFLVDLVCHGVPSQKLLRDDVKNILEKNNITDGNAKIIFRKKIENKIVFGLFICKQNNIEINIAKKYVDLLKNNYITAFMSGITFRKNCFSCSYAQPQRCSDITLADFWGLAQCSIPQDKGVSLLLPSTEKGLSLINAISDKLHIEERPVGEAIKGNGQLNKPSVMPKNKAAFEDMYAITPQKAYKIYLKSYKKEYKRNRLKAKLRSWRYKHKNITAPLLKIYRLFK